jgi:hypothetical protein
MSALLFYGPEAQTQALERADLLGRQVHPPLGYEPPDKTRKGYRFLLVDNARLAVSLLASTPIGDQIGTLVIGPIDRAADKSCDVLLKALEEFDPGRVIPVLWAFDLESVRPTIQSRTIPVYAPGDETSMWPEGLMTAAQVAFRAATATPTRPWEFIEALEPFSEQILEVIEALVWNASLEPTLESLRLWESLRDLALLGNPRWLELMSVLVRGGK